MGRWEWIKLTTRSPRRHVVAFRGRRIKPGGAPLRSWILHKVGKTLGVRSVAIEEETWTNTDSVVVVVYKLLLRGEAA